MTFALTQLKQILSSKASSKTGVVVGISSSEVRVATQSGLATAAPVGILQTGDRVALDDGGLAFKIPEIINVVQV
jgi:hypothetical protein